MSLELRHLRAFHAVAEELSFRRAAERLGLAQPALSRTIRALEESLDVRLFERSTRVVGLTEAGRAFQRRTAAVLADLAEAVRFVARVQGGAAGELRVGYNDHAINGLLPLIVRRFRADWPDVEVSLIDATSPAMIEMVLDGKLDIAFHHGPMGHRDIDQVLVRGERLICALPAAHRLAGEAAISLPDLAGESFVMGTLETWKVFHTLLRDFCRPYGVELKVIQEALHSDGILGLVAAGLGISLFVDSEWIHAIRGVVVRPLKEAAPRIETLASWRRDRGHLPVLRHFLEVVAAVVDEEGVEFRYRPRETSGAQPRRRRARAAAG